LLWEIPRYLIHVPMYITERSCPTRVVPTSLLGRSNRYFPSNEPTEHNAHTKATKRALPQLFYRSSFLQSDNLHNQTAIRAPPSTVQPFVFLQTDSAQTQATRRAAPWVALSFVFPSDKHRSNSFAPRAIAQALHQSPISIRLLHIEGYSVNRSTIQRLFFLSKDNLQAQANKPGSSMIIPPVPLC
jgi:hypothetical protein